MAYEGKGEQKAGDWCKFCRAKPVCKALAEEALALCREEFVDLDAAENTEKTADKTAVAAVVAVTAVTADTECKNNADHSSDCNSDEAEEITDITAPYSPDYSAPVFKRPGLIPLSELAEILPTLNRISSWIEAVFAYVSSEAINHGIPIKGYKVVEGRSARTFTDVKAVAKTAIDNGYTNIYKQQLISLTEIEKLMGKRRFSELLGRFIVKPPGKLSLVPESDPRPAVNIDSKTALNQEFAVLSDSEDF